MSRVKTIAILPFVLLVTSCSQDPELVRLVRAQAAKLQQLEDVAAIERLQLAYGYYVDKHLWNEVVDLFAEESTAEIAQRGVFLNKAGARKMFFERMGGGRIGLQRGTLFNHIQVGGIVDVDPNGTTGQGRFRAIVQVAGFGGDREFWSDGIYENEFIKEDGVWKFSKLKFWPTYYTPFKEGFNSDKHVCINGDGSWISPGADQPSQDHAGVFPNVYYPPFHYVNPVTGKAVDVSELNQKALAETVWPSCK